VSTLLDLHALGAPSARPVSLRVSNAAAKSVQRGHPWLFETAITHQSHEGAPGDVAVLYDGKRKFVGVGLYDPDSPMRVKVLARGKPTTVDAAFFDAAIARAAERRAALEPTGTHGYRLIHGENDGLGGLVVDRYADTLVVKLYSRAWLVHLEAVVDCLLRHQKPARVVLRLSRNVEREHSLPAGVQNGALLFGDAPPERVVFRENGIRFGADVIHGQKTGFFLDQRENRARIEKVSEGRRVLNVFAYSGGFSLYAARGGATEVVSLDLSRPALVEAERNFALNQDIPAVASCRHRILAADAFEALALMKRRGERYDVVIIDPPSFAKKQSEIEGALAAYARLTRLGLDVLEDGGLIVLASCSSRVGAEAFFETVEEAARAHGRPLEVVETTAHAVDHPIGFPEGAYLKCVFAHA